MIQDEEALADVEEDMRYKEALADVEEDMRYKMTTDKIQLHSSHEVLQTTCDSHPRQ